MSRQRTTAFHYKWRPTQACPVKRAIWGTVAPELMDPLKSLLNSEAASKVLLLLISESSERLEELIDYVSVMSFLWRSAVALPCLRH